MLNSRLWSYLTRRRPKAEAIAVKHSILVFEYYAKVLKQALLNLPNPDRLVEYPTNIVHALSSPMIVLESEAVAMYANMFKELMKPVVSAEVNNLAKIIATIQRRWKRKKDITPVGPPADIDKDELNAAIIAELERDYFIMRAVLLSSYENEQIYERIRNIIERAVRGGWTIRVTAEEIAGSIGGNYSKIRSTVIARTEVNSMVNTASYRAMRRSGVVSGKIWVAVMDQRTRDPHAAANGQQVAINDKFLVGGEYMMFPGDPDASARNLVNCRCSMFPIISPQFVPFGTTTDNIVNDLIGD